METLWMIMLLVSFLSFVGSILLMFIWKIPDLIDELSGRKAKRQIKLLHEMNINTGAFDKLSTTDLYSSLHTGAMVSDLSPISEEEKEVVKKNEDIREVVSDDTDGATSFLEETEGETTYMEGDGNDFSRMMSESIIVLEEQSSIF